ncbi:TPA: peptide deformylase [Legionella pneumophila]|uniref:peptide deformylase n=1 Tax=Legionella pneumophila TaxID=446 RepID=UPI0007879503|nr:peptide deformylase [Legionella pneumophila]HAU1190623.1 peptide deformylase [Legionella pneumophila]HBD7100624.1 peptide deformylase [Legionella pneumophila]HCO4737564.1 peptide deformylase [Legionella pneumophila]HEG4431326.1 peptide deformylase [Legionella pneumophila]HEN5662512.1 peptide deformylase [Legionella pneumophila]
MNTLLDKNDPILRQTAETIVESEFGSNWLKELIKTMFDIMADKGAVGVAAPQIGISKRVIVFGTNYTKRRKPEYPIPDTALINPSLKILSQEIQTGYEGCLNCGELMGEVPRAMDIEYSGFDIDGNSITKKASGLEARILQHEIDHLDGFLFLDRVEDQGSITTLSELQNKG